MLAGKLFARIEFLTGPTGIRAADVSAETPTADPARFAGHATIHHIARALGTGEVRVNVLFFDAGARTRPHAHPYDQLLYYTQGVGVVAQDGGEDQRIEEGEFVLLPAGRVHMHGAASDGPAVHISIMCQSDNAADHNRPVSNWNMSVPEAWRRWRQ